MLPIKRITQKRWLFGSILALLSAGLILSALVWTKDSRKFEKLSKELFLSDLSDNALSLHYTLAYPENYGFPDEIVFSSWQSEENSNGTDIQEALDKLSEISADKLNDNDSYAYKLLERYLNLRLSGISYSYYSEPLSPSSGMQSGLPILLADYTFRNEQDVEDYLHILDQVDTYFEGLIAYEQEKAKKGLFMSDYAAQEIIKQCDAIMDKDALASGSHFLHTTFQERLDVLEKEGIITLEQKNSWLSENDRLLTTVVAPAYEKLADAFTVLKGSGCNDNGLYYFPEGCSYYEYLLASTTGSSRSIPEIKKMLYQDFQENYSALAALLKEHPELSTLSSDIYSSFPYAKPDEMLEDLKNRMSVDFPAFPKTQEDFVPSYTIKSVSPSMEDYCSPAYYLTPPIDDMTNNIIYINHKNAPDVLTLYTTLAHEGYPGHLYQTVYSQLFMNQQEAPYIRYLLHYGGYVEGWALYVENMSYSYAQEIVKDSDPAAAVWYEACRLNRNIQLCLYSLLDIAIHYEGATFTQTHAILKKLGINDPATSASIYRYIVEEPVNYLKYYLGFLEFLSLRKSAAALWGDSFSLQRFHQFILEAGPSDFQSLQEKLISASPPPSFLPDNHHPKAGF